MLTRKDVRALVAEVEAARGDDEKAHGLEDNLVILVLEAIAKGQCEDPRGCAAEALKTQSFDFSRWCA